MEKTCDEGLDRPGPSLNNPSPSSKPSTSSEDGGKKSRKDVEYSLEAFAKAEHWVWEAFKEHQKAQDDLEILKEMGKDILASIMTHISTEEKTSETKLERLARSSKDWATYRNGWFAAVKAAGEAKVRYQTAQLQWSTIQSGLSYRKEELKKLGGGGP